jgi:hypothetical protein
MSSRPNRWAVGCFAAGAVTLGLSAWSLADVAARMSTPTGFSGARGFSDAWNPPPFDHEGTWLVSRGLVSPPAIDANPAELREWLSDAYPVLSLARTIKEVDLEGGRKALDLGGGPPRRLYVEPGEGLVMRLGAP